MMRDLRTAIRMGAIVLVACIVFGLSSSACYPHTVRTYKPGTMTSLEVINSIFDDNDHAVCWLQWTGSRGKGWRMAARSQGRSLHRSVSRRPGRMTSPSKCDTPGKRSTGQSGRGERRLSTGGRTDGASSMLFDSSLINLAKTKTSCK